MITMDLREAIQLQSVYGPSTGAYALVADLGQARDSVLQFLTAPLRTYLTYSVGNGLRDLRPMTTSNLLDALEIERDMWRTGHGNTYNALQAARDSVLAFLCAPLRVCTACGEIYNPNDPQEHAAAPFIGARQV